MIGVQYTVTKKSQSVLIDIDGATDSHKAGLRNALHDIGELFKREQARILTTGPKTGRVYLRSGRNHQASAPREAPASDTGRLVRSANYRVSSWRSMTVGEKAPYAVYLEEGTFKMRPRPHMIVAANGIAGDAVNLLYRRTMEEINK